MVNNDKVPELTAGEFDNFIKKGFALVDFFADWCMPCVMMSPILDELSEDFKKKVKVARVNIDENQNLAVKFQVSSIPNFVLFKDGEKIDQIIGGMSKDDLANFMKKHL